MINSLKKKMSLIAMIGLGLSVASCAQTKGTEYQQGRNSESQASAPAKPDSNVDMAMNMPEKVTSKPPKEMPASADTNQVVIENFSFAPATLTVKAGTKVTWINRDDVPHTVNENDKRFKSGTMDTDDQFSYTFSSAGTFSYFCALHPKMTGQIIVK